MGFWSSNRSRNDSQGINPESVLGLTSIRLGIMGSVGPVEDNRKRLNVRLSHISRPETKNVLRLLCAISRLSDWIDMQDA